ncbi:hypothetical protein EAE96_003217 [Botrytis aclada]|nr:hypothetical protein EAE96_003217 [Botrytis aclada]
MTVTQFNGSKRKASVRSSAITFEDSELDLQLDSLTSISNTGNEDNLSENLLHSSSSTSDLPRSPLQGFDDDSADEQQSKHLILIPASSALGNTLLVNDPSSTHSYTRTTLTPVANCNKVSWNIDWQQPTLIISMLLIGFLLSVGHNVFYNSLDGTIAGGSARQAWSLQMGAAFAFLAVICFRVAIVAALNQLIWKIVKDAALTIGSLDKLFTLATNPFGIFNLCFLRNARLAAFIGVIFWCMDFMSFAPTATLSVVAKNVSVEVAILVLNSSGTSWNRAGLSNFDQSNPSNRIAWQSAYISDVVPLPHPVSSPNWSYNVNFFGPSFKCRLADSTEQVDFNRVTRALEIEERTFTATQMNDQHWNLTIHPSALSNGSHENSSDSASDYWMNSTVRDLLFYSSWATSTLREYTNSWYPDARIASDSAPTDESFFWSTSYDLSPVSKYILLQTSTSSIVCSPVNNSFEVTIASINGRQQITQRGVTPVETRSLNVQDLDMSMYESSLSH